MSNRAAFIHICSALLTILVIVTFDMTIPEILLTGIAIGIVTGVIASYVDDNYW